MKRFQELMTMTPEAAGDYICALTQEIDTENDYICSDACPVRSLCVKGRNGWRTLFDGEPEEWERTLIKEGR